MAKKELTDIFLRKVSGTNTEYSDTYTSGLRLRIQKSRKVFCFLYKVNGKKRRLTIGEYPHTTLKQARDIITKAKADLLNGIDPQAGKDQLKKSLQTEQALTVKQGLDKFINKYAKKNIKTWVDYQRAFNRLNTKAQNIPIQDLQTITIRDYLDKITDTSGKVSGNQAYTFLKSAFNWLYNNQYIQVQPMQNITKPNPTAEKSRERVLDDNELKQLLTSTDKLGYPYGDFVKVLILTGQRRKEVATMQRKELDFKNKLWTIPSDKAKNKKEHKVPLSPQVITILESIPSGGQYLFSTTKGDKAINGFGKAIERIRKASDLHDWGFHDLRRTLATNLSKQKTPDTVISAILNHSTKALQGITSVYNRHDLLNERTTALNKYADWVDRLLITDNTTDKVINFPR